MVNFKYYRKIFCIKDLRDFLKLQKITESDIKEYLLYLKKRCRSYIKCVADSYNEIVFYAYCIFYYFKLKIKIIFFYICLSHAVLTPILKTITKIEKRININ